MKKLLAFVAFVASLLATPALAQSIVYACECSSAGSGSHASCAAGSSGVAFGSTSASTPRDRFSNAELNSLAAGSTVRLCAGGNFLNWRLTLDNRNATLASPITFEPYAPPSGATGNPRLTENTANTTVLFSGPFGDNLVLDGGYYFKNLVLDGLQIGTQGFYIGNVVRGVTLEDVELTGYNTCINMAHHGPEVGNGQDGTRMVTLRRINVHHCFDIGILGSAHDFLLEDSVFDQNNADGGNQDHAIYLGSSSRTSYRTLVRNNTFTNNSGSTCSGGNVTMHGQYDTVTFEGNLIRNDAFTFGCQCFSITVGYDTSQPPEHFDNLVVRGNTVVNCGGGIVIDAAVAPLVENNFVVNTTTTASNGIGPGFQGSDTYDQVPSGAIVRNNTIYYTQAGSGSGAITNFLGANKVVASNVIYFGGTNGHTCFTHDAIGNYTAFVANTCHHASGEGSGRNWSSTHTTLAAAQAAGFDAAGSNADPLFAAAPAVGNSWAPALQSGSPAINAAHATHKSRLGFQSVEVHTSRDRGAREYRP